MDATETGDSHFGNLGTPARKNPAAWGRKDRREGLDCRTLGAGFACWCLGVPLVVESALMVVVKMGFAVPCLIDRCLVLDGKIAVLAIAGVAQETVPHVTGTSNVARRAASGISENVHPNRIGAGVIPYGVSAECERPGHCRLPARMEGVRSRE